MIDLKIAVAGTGYVGLSLAVLLSQHNEVIAVDILPEKVESFDYNRRTKDIYYETVSGIFKYNENNKTVTPGKIL